MGLFLKSIWKIQLVQNVAVQVVSGARYMAHVTPLLRKLHWLPLCFWVQFKVPDVTFKALRSLGLGYLRNRLFARVSTCPAQFSGMGMLQIP